VSSVYRQALSRRLVHLAHYMAAPRPFQAPQVLSLPLAVSVAWVTGAETAVLPVSVVVEEEVVAVAVCSSDGVPVHTTFRQTPATIPGLPTRRSFAPPIYSLASPPRR
jgi:hypothetical protein